MEVRKAIKKIVALGVGASMMGATMLGAMAADLADYPKPMFIGDDGTFNGIVVMGAAAAAEDVIGASNILANLQAVATRTVTVSTSSATTTTLSGEGVKIETDSNELTMGEKLNAVKTSLDDGDLPTLLADGVYVNDGDDASTSHQYTQKLKFGGNATVLFLEDRDYDLSPNSPIVAVFGPKKGTFMTYELDFTKDPETDVDSNSNDCGDTAEMCDFEDTKIEILGMTYDITKAEKSTDAVTLELMGGSTVQTLYEGETATYTIDGVDYEVHVDIISDTGPSVIMSVNADPTKELRVGGTDMVAGIEIGVKQVLANEAGESEAGKDLVQFYLGANKVKLYDSNSSVDGVSDNLEIGSDDVDDLYVDITTGTSGSRTTLQKILITWKPDDDIFVTEEQSITMPGLGSYEVSFAGLIGGTEEQVIIEPHGNDKVQLTVPLETGEQTFDVLFDTGGDGNYNGLGASASEKLIIAATNSVAEGNYLVVTSASEEESHIVEIDKIASDGVVTMKDLNGVKYQGTCGTSSTCTINIGDNSVTLYADATAGTVNITAGVGANIYTKEGLQVALVDPGASDAATEIVVTEEDTNGNVGAGNAVTFNITFTSDSKATVKDIIGAAALRIASENGRTSAWEDVADSENFAAYTTFGTEIIHHKGGDEDWAELIYPGAEAHAQVYVSVIGAAITQSAAAGVTTTEVVPIPTTASKLDREVTDITAQNAIVVGGPCANTATAVLMGNPANCVEGFEEGKAKIKLFSNAGKVGMLVAGYSALDTRRATTVVANFASYTDELVGEEVEVTGTSLTDISVGTPTPAAPAAPVVPAAPAADAGGATGG
ncbi:MAG: hypothetical protein ABH879_03370 [archaeon]